MQRGKRRSSKAELTAQHIICRVYLWPSCSASISHMQTHNLGTNIIVCLRLYTEIKLLCSLPPNLFCNEVENGSGLTELQ